MANSTEYSARLNVDYPEELDRLTTLFRIIWIIPIAIILALITTAGETVIVNEAGEVIRKMGGIAQRSRCGHRPYDCFSSALPALVVRFRARAGSVRGTCHSLSRPAYRPLSIDSRRTGGAPGCGLSRRRKRP